MSDKTPCVCDNCEWKGDIDDLLEPTDLYERLDPGGVVPAGECPKCGALAYLFPVPADLQSPERLIEEAFRRLVERCDGPAGVRADGSNIDTSAEHAVLDAYSRATLHMALGEKVEPRYDR